jgi:hypothetical protein
MEISVPQLDIGLHFEPSQTDKKTEYHTGSVVLTAGPPSCFDYILGDDPTVGVGEDALVDLTGDDLFNLIFQSQSNLGDLLGGL